MNKKSKEEVLVLSFKPSKIIDTFHLTYDCPHGNR